MAAREGEYRVQRLRGGSFTWCPTGIRMLQLMAHGPGTISCWWAIRVCFNCKVGIRNQSSICPNTQKRVSWGHSDEKAAVQMQPYGTSLTKTPWTGAVGKSLSSFYALFCSHSVIEHPHIESWQASSHWHLYISCCIYKYLFSRPFPAPARTTLLAHSGPL